MNPAAPAPPRVDAGGTRLVRAACPHDCPDTCAMLVSVRDGVAVQVRGDPAHPTTAGVLCTKVSRYLERTYHPQRVLQPLRRCGPKGSGAYEAVSWDAALDDIASRLRALAQVDPQAIVPYSYAGTMGLVQGEAMAARLFHRLGASRLDRTICASAGAEGLRQVLGGLVGMDVEQFVHSRLILIWGSNSITSNLHFWSLAQQAGRAGATLVCIDPWRNDTARRCHLHLQLRPGTDAALAWGLMGELVRNDWLDHDYIRDHTLGFEPLRERALQWTPERAAQVCGLQAQQVRELAALLGRTPAAAIRVNYGLQRVRGGGNAVRAIACLPALTGAWREPAGGLLLSSSGHFAVARNALERPDLLGSRRPRTINMSTIGDALLHPGGDDFGPRIDALVVYNSNPAVVAPDSGKVLRGLRREDLFTVVLEHFRTDTADLADYILPATTQLEHLDLLKAYGHRYWVANEPAIAPLGQARPNSQIFRDLAARLGYADACFGDSDEDLAAQALADDPRNAGLDFATLRRQGWGKLAVPDAPFAHGGFPTPSGRCQFVYPPDARAGRDPLPQVILPYESAQTQPELAARYPLALLSPPARNFLNSSFVNVESLRQRETEPRLLLHPRDAAARAIVQGQRVRLFNDRGEMLARCHVTDDTREGQVVSLGLWWRKLAPDGRGVNDLTHQRLTDLGAGPCFHDCLVQVEPAS